MIVATKKAVTVDELAKMPDGDRYELDHGNLVERAMSPMSGYVSMQIGAEFVLYVRQNPIAYVFADNTGYTLFQDDEMHLRKPDCSIVLKSRLPDPGVIPNTRFGFAPNLAVEVLSPSDNSYDVENKINEYLEAGTQIVWLVRPISKRIVAYSLDGNEISYGPNDTITAEPVLPGFRMRVSSVFP